MPQTRAHARATARWEKKNYDRALVRLRKDSPVNLNAVRMFATERGESLNGFIVRAITKVMKAEAIKG